jgi:hypothetical protein
MHCSHSKLQNFSRSGRARSDAASKLLGPSKKGLPEKVWVNLGINASESLVIAGFRACESGLKSDGVFGWRLQRGSGGCKTHTLSQAFGR